MKEDEPLTLEETRELLQRAATSTDWHELNDILCRLDEGVRGDDEDALRRVGELNSLYVGTLKSDPGRLPSMAEEFYSLLAGDRDAQH